MKIFRNVDEVEFVGGEEIDSDFGVEADLRLFIYSATKKNQNIINLLMRVQDEAQTSEKITFS